MRTLSAHVFVSKFTKFSVSGKVEVEGLGEIELKDCLSHETCERLFAEVEEVARLRLKLTKEQQ